MKKTAGPVSTVGKALGGGVKSLLTGPAKYVTLPVAAGTLGGAAMYAADKRALPEHLQPLQTKYNRRKGAWMAGGGLTGAGLGAGIGNLFGGTKAGLIAGLLGGLGGAYLGAGHAARREREKLDDEAISQANQRFYPVRF